MCNLIKAFMEGAEVFKFMRVWGKGVVCSALIITYNVCMFRRRWWRWGLLPMFHRVVLVTAGGGAENLFYWVGNTGVTCMLVGVLDLCQSVMTM